MPDPLLFTLDEPMTLDESARLKEETWEKLRARWDPTWDAMIDVMCAPEMFIRIRGWDELDIENGQKCIYMHFARSGAQAFKFEQKPGKTFWHTDGFVVTECDPRSLAGEVVRSLPTVDAGRLPNIPIIIDPREHILRYARVADRIGADRTRAFGIRTARYSGDEDAVARRDRGRPLCDGYG